MAVVIHRTKTDPKGQQGLAAPYSTLPLGFLLIGVKRVGSFYPSGQKQVEVPELC